VSDSTNTESSKHGPSHKESGPLSIMPSFGRFHECRQEKDKKDCRLHSRAQVHRGMKRRIH
jgi:hypothetical protein